MPDWEKSGDEMDENISNTVKKFAELFYVTIAWDRSLSIIPEWKWCFGKKPKRREKKVK